MKIRRASWIEVGVEVVDDAPYTYFTKNRGLFGQYDGSVGAYESFSSVNFVGEISLTMIQTVMIWTRCYTDD